MNTYRISDIEITRQIRANNKIVEVKIFRAYELNEEKNAYVYVGHFVADVDVEDDKLWEVADTEIKGRHYE